MISAKDIFFEIRAQEAQTDNITFQIGEGEYQEVIEDL